MKSYKKILLTAAASLIIGTQADSTGGFLGGGTNYIITPAIVKQWFGGGAGTQQARPYGMAQQGRSSADAPSTGRTTGANTNQWGPGRRLGE